MFRYYSESTHTYTQVLYDLSSFGKSRVQDNVEEERLERKTL